MQSSVQHPKSKLKHNKTIKHNNLSECKQTAVQWAAPTSRMQKRAQMVNVDPWKCHSTQGTQDGPATTNRDWDAGGITYHNTSQTGKQKPRTQIFKVKRISIAGDLEDKLTENLLHAGCNQETYQPTQLWKETPRLLRSSLWFSQPWPIDEI